ncbi:MAG: hypothetical protein R3B60_05285 [Candidatus Paceibacterota bacterium]
MAKKKKEEDIERPDKDVEIDKDSPKFKEVLGAFLPKKDSRNEK